MSVSSVNSRSYPASPVPPVKRSAEAVKPAQSNQDDSVKVSLSGGRVQAVSSDANVRALKADARMKVALSAA